jgi:nitroimidazol reductase NimA-like FMN-containing flavoprotein (pyridoxamine 5'-phosphate oxidase superfamily)
MQDSDLVARAAELIKTIPYLNLATCAADRPWSSPVYATHDGDLNFYWSSWKEAIHSVNLVGNPRASFTIYDSTRPRGTNNYRCLYVECTVTTIADTAEAEHAFRMIYPDHAVALEDFLAPGIKRFYKAKPTAAWLNCLSERELTPTTLKMRIEVGLPALRAAL